MPEFSVLAEVGRRFGSRVAVPEERSASRSLDRGFIDEIIAFGKTCYTAGEVSGIDTALDPDMASDLARIREAKQGWVMRVQETPPREKA